MASTKEICSCGHEDNEHQFDTPHPTLKAAIERGEVFRACMSCQCSDYFVVPKDEVETV